ncbi:Oxalate decarboxylase family bicupin [Tolypocladium paradoxum]|uniref:Oxalate decarboxylase family bicupin n=1 Tax=Tolypocladium paradoxum TaxID=94208 RepID=A0A2S4L6R8_9HYPO|nr:Oxalate decarboxylase family bicupin [Tolypocladium paradoxum]
MVTQARPRIKKDHSSAMGCQYISRKAPGSMTACAAATVLEMGTLSFTDSHTRTETRQTTVRELPTSVELASVNIRLDSGVIRELHWHKEAEWSYVLDGEVRVTALDYEGGNFIDDLKKGDLWDFPSGVPHSLQGLGENGTEFLLIFDDGYFSEESAFILLNCYF